MITISDSARQDLQWWLTNIQGFSTKVKDRYVDQVSITTDASLSGWGAVFGDIKQGDYGHQMKEGFI